MEQMFTETVCFLVFKLLILALMSAVVLEQNLTNRALD